MRRLAAIAVAVAALVTGARAQVFSPAQEAELRQRYLNSTGFSGTIISPGTVPADRLVGTGITFLTESSSGAVTGRWGRLGISSGATPRVRGITLGTTDFLVNGTLRFNPSAGRVEVYNNGWQAMAGGVERVFVGSSSVTGVTALGMQSSSTNILVGVSGTNGTATFVLTPVGPVGVKGDNGVGNMWFSGAWSAAQPYSSNTLVSYGGSIYVTRVDLLAGNTNTPLDTAAFLLVITSGTDGTDGVDGGGFLWRGPWDAFTGYGSTQSVTHAGSVWVSLAGSTNVEPGVHASWTNYWLQAVEAGTDGGSVVSNLIWTAEEFVSGNPAASNAVYTYDGETWAALRDLLAGSGAPAAGTNWIKLAAKGAGGSSGADGTDGADGIGNMWFAQEWDSLRTYSSNTLVVRYQQMYYSKVDVAAGTDPFTQPAYWGVAARRGNDGLNYYFGGEWSGIVTYTNDALVFYSSAWWRSLQASAGVTPALSGSATSYWRRLVEVTSVGETGTMAQVVSRGGDLGLHWATNVPLNHGTGTVPLASLSGITSNQIDPATDTAYRSGSGGSASQSPWTNNVNGAGYTLSNVVIESSSISITNSPDVVVWIQWQGHRLSAATAPTHMDLMPTNRSAIQLIVQTNIGSYWSETNWTFSPPVGSYIIHLYAIDGSAGSVSEWAAWPVRNGVTLSMTITNQITANSPVPWGVSSDIGGYNGGAVIMPIWNDHPTNVWTVRVQHEDPATAILFSGALRIMKVGGRW